MTPEERAKCRRIVLKHFPQASCGRLDARFYAVSDPQAGQLGTGTHEDGAWLSAMIRLQDLLGPQP